MATGYTYPIVESESHTFSEYFWHCLEAFCVREGVFFGSLMDPGYYEKEIADDERELAELKAMSLEDAKARSLEEYHGALKRNDEHKKYNSKTAMRLNTMRKAVETWDSPGPEFEKGVKRFMLEQIDETLKFDCGEFDCHKDPERPVTGYKWRNDAIERVEYSLEYNKKKLAEEIERRKTWFAYLNAAKASVPMPPKDSKFYPKWAEVTE